MIHFLNYCERFDDQDKSKNGVTRRVTRSTSIFVSAMRRGKKTPRQDKDFGFLIIGLINLKIYNDLDLLMLILLRD